MKSKLKKGGKEGRWSKAAALFEDPQLFDKIAQNSRVLTLSEQRTLLGPSRTKQISIRMPIEDIDAVKAIADATDRSYQQLVVLAVEQYIDRVASELRQRKSRPA